MFGVNLDGSCSFVPHVTDDFADTSVHQLKAIVLNTTCSSSVKVVVLSEECGRVGVFSLIHLDLLCLSDMLGGYYIPLRDGEGDSVGPLAKLKASILRKLTEISLLAPESQWRKLSPAHPFLGRTEFKMPRYYQIVEHRTFDGHLLSLACRSLTS